ncbi:MAG TPA: TolC family protein, partial [Vicinamibacterales bacterium]|nr:TolC family protein [Vicinamibacterales bacterium]
QKRYEVGMSTNFNVIQAQRDLAVARNNELQVQLDYQLALINFVASQKISTGGLDATTTTTGGASTTGGATAGAAPVTTTTTVAPAGAGGGGQ